MRRESATERFLGGKASNGQPITGEADILDEIFVDFESSIPSWDIYVVRKFFRTYARDVTDTQQQQARAKLDARGLVGATKRQYPEWLTPSDLCGYLDEKLDRYIYRLCPKYILALLRTAYYHQQAPLREAIWKHIAGEAVVRVQAPEPSEESDIYQEDYVATDGEGPADGRTISLDRPIWCARQYWLQTVDIRMRIVHKEWTWLVRSTEADIKAWASKNPFLSTKDLETTQHNRLGVLLDWVVEKTELLRKLNENLGNSIRAWDRFNGDKNYLSDLQKAPAISALTSLEKILESLVDLKRKLRSLEKTCEKAEKIVSFSEHL
ncbi:hypothetical protein N0V95_006490 [Ascochyta clinopodiicola]|nr:hypothetical protein N0V95_006490 [Ascochyta clinopodiicola]